MLSVKSWFINKNFTENQKSALATAYGYKIEKETEKAYFLNADTDYGCIKFWCPKSCTVEISDDEEDARPIEEVMAEFNLTKEDMGNFNFFRKVSDYASGRITKAELEEAISKKDEGLKYNARLVEFCKVAGIKITNRRYATATLIEKIQNAGLEVPAR